MGGDIQRNVSTILTNEKDIRSQGKTGRFVQFLKKLPAIAGDCVSSKVKTFIKLIFYTTNEVRLTYFCLWGSPAAADVLLRCLKSPSVTETNRPCNQTIKPHVLRYCILQTAWQYRTQVYSCGPPPGQVLPENGMLRYKITILPHPPQLKDD